MALIAGVPSVTLDQLENRFANGKDTTYVVNFWATWCKPCVEELPAFDALARKNVGNAVVVLLVSVDSPKDKEKKVEPYLRQKGYRCESVLLNESKPNEWIDRVDSTWSGAIPATLFLRNNKRQFFEQEFSTSTLQTALETFVQRQ